MLKKCYQIVGINRRTNVVNGPKMMGNKCCRNEQKTIMWRCVCVVKSSCHHSISILPREIKRKWWSLEERRNGKWWPAINQKQANFRNIFYIGWNNRQTWRKGARKRIVLFIIFHWQNNSSKFSLKSPFVNKPKNA